MTPPIKTEGLVRGASHAARAVGQAIGLPGLALKASGVCAGRLPRPPATIKDCGSLLSSGLRLGALRFYEFARFNVTTFTRLNDFQLSGRRLNWLRLLKASAQSQRRKQGESLQSKTPYPNALTLPGFARGWQVAHGGNADDIGQFFLLNFRCAHGL